MRKTGMRLLAVLLAVVMVLPSVLIPGMAAEATGFTDVPEGSWYADAVNYVSEKGYMAGVGDNRFAPNDEVTRAMFVTILARITMAETDGTASAFTDVPENKWYTGAVNWAAENGIVNGVGDGMFAPGKSITRQDLCTILYRFVNAMDYELTVGEEKTFTDSASVSSYAAEAVRYASSVGLIAGYDDGTFRPKATATRAQMAVIIMRLARLLDGQIVKPEPMPAQSFNGAAGDDMTVSVNAPEGALPENTKMTVSRVSDEMSLAALKSLVNNKIYAAADISFSKGSVELEPKTEVEVQLELAGLDGIENPAVVHIRDDGNVEYINSELVSLDRAGNQKALRFHAKDFSVYAVTEGSGTGFYNVTVEFYARANGSSGDWQLINKQIVRNDQLGTGKTPVTDPGVPTIDENQSFEGWFEATTAPVSFSDADADEGQSVADINDTVNGKSGEATLKYYALIYDVVYITYHDQAGNVLETESNHVTFAADGTATLAKVFEKTYIPYKGDQKFFGWTPQSNVKVENGEMVLGDYPEYVSTDESAYYEVDGNPVDPPLAFSKSNNDLHVYPFVARGYWLIFDNNISVNNDASHNNFNDATSASYTAPKLYMAGVNTVEPTVPSRKGYTFGGWYSDPGMSRSYSFGQPLTADTTVYAKWTPDTTDYYVVYWKQQATDSVNAAEKHYDYVNRVKKTATTGTPVSLSSSDTVYNVAANTEDPYYFEYSAADSTTGSVQVKGDGTTVLNVRYNRKPITFRFGPATAKYYVESSPDWSKHYVYYVKSGNTYLECQRVSSYGSYAYYYTEYTGSLNYYGTYYMLLNNTFCQLVNSGGYWYISYNGQLYNTTASDNGKVYTGSTSAPSTLYYQKYELTSATTTLRGLYGHQLDTNDWPAAYSGKCWSNFDESNKTVYQYPMPLLEFVPTWLEGTTLQQDFYEQDFSTSVIKVYYYGASLSNTSYYSVKLNEGTAAMGGKWYPTESVQGFTIKGYKFASSLPAANTTWTSCTSGSIISIGESETRNLYFAFDRNQYNLVFSSTTANGTANDTVSVYYDAPLSSFKDRQPTNSNPGYYFDGWYADANCETPFDFSGNMPAHNVMVYAKWTKIRFRTVLDYNAPADQVTFPGNQADSFRLDYGEPVQESAIMAAERKGYVLLGWYYTDNKGKEQNFNFNMGAHEDMADMTYGNRKTNAAGEFTETEAEFLARMDSAARTGTYQVPGVIDKDTGTTTWSDKWTESNTKRKDVRGYIRIYAKWRENPEGLTGVNVKYFADTDYEHYDKVQEGYFNPNQSKDVWDDPYIYTNLAEAYAQAASSPFNVKQKFLYWEIVNEAGDVVKTVYPGQTFTVQTGDAHYTHTLKDQYVVCEHKDENDVSTIEAVAAVAPTCTATGLKAHYRCTLCGRLFTDAAGTERTTLEAQTVPVTEPVETRGLNPGQPVTVTNTVWEPVDTINLGEEYLIGYTFSNGTTYLMMSYNPADSAYYTSANITGYTANRVCYAIPAILDASGNVTGVDTTNFSGATLNHAAWTFAEGSTSEKYRIQSVYDTSKYLRVDNNGSSYSTYLGLYPAAYSSNYSQYWMWDSANKYLYYFNSSAYLTKYISVLINTSSGEVTCFDAHADSDYAISLQLYHKVVSHTLTVNFAGPDDGTFQAPATFTVQIPEGTAYSYDVAELISNNNLGGNVTGYTPNATAITGTMGAEDVTVTVTYRETVVKTERWHEVETIDDVTKDYLIGVEINGQIYLLVNNSTFTYNGTQYTKVGLAAFEGAILTSVSGATDDLTNCRWNFSTANGGTITSAQNSSMGLYYTENGGLYPSATPDTWVWGGSAHTMAATVTNTWYMYGTTVNGTEVASVKQGTSGATVHIYREVEDENTSYDVVFVDEDGNAYTSIPTQTINSGEKASEPAAPEKADYYFLGWYEEGADTPFNFNTPIEKDYKLYARYDYMYIDTYTVWLRAVYGIPNTTGTTHIYWYENDGTTATVTETVNGEPTQISFGEGAGDRYEQNEINMNVGVDIPTPANWTGRTDASQHLTNREDRVFLGWARVKNEGGAASGSDHSWLDEDDLYLKWNGTQYQIKNNDGEWVDLPTFATTGHAYGGNVGQVYATEETPYHDMYAVWATYAYVLHSSSGKLEAIRLRYSDEDQMPENLVQLVGDNFLYGGYYKTYGGAKNILDRADSADNSMKTYKNTAMDKAFQIEFRNSTEDKNVNTGAETYDGSKTKTQSQSTNGRFWTKAQAYTEPTGENVTPEDKYNVMGNHMFPVMGTVYYLKEVPEQYLTTKYLYTYETMEGENEGVIQNFFMLTVMDDAFYKEIGFRTVEGAKNVQEATNADITPRTAIAGKFEVIQRGNHIAGHPRCDDKIVTVDPSNFGLTRGFIAVTQADALITEEAGKSFTVMPAWETLDGVEVNSHGTLKLDVTSDKKTIRNELLGSVATPTTLFIDTDPSHLVLNQDDGTVWETADALTRVYIFNGSKNMWLDATKLRDNYYSVSIPAGDWTLNVVRCNPDPTKTGWDAAWTQTVDIPLDRRKDLLILNSGFNDGNLYNYTYTVVNNI